jgi:hypothetical protein
VTTFYARFGDVFVYGCLAVLVLVVVLSRGAPGNAETDGRKAA